MTISLAFLINDWFDFLEILNIFLECFIISCSMVYSFGYPLIFRFFQEQYKECDIPL